MLPKIKKCFCLILSSVLLFSNGQVFAQEVLSSAIIAPYEIEELEKMAGLLEAKYNFSLRHIKSDASLVKSNLRGDGILKSPYDMEDIIQNSLTKYDKDLHNFETMLDEFQTKMRTTYQKYLDALPEGTYLKKATTQYVNKRMNTLFERQKRILSGNFLSLSELIQEQPEVLDMSSILHPAIYRNEHIRKQRLLEFYTKDSHMRNQLIADLAEHQSYYDKIFTWDMEKLIDQLKAANRSFSYEAVEFFSKPTHTAEEILEYFATHGPQNKKALAFALRTTDRGVTTKQLIPYLRYYLKHTNRRFWKLEQYSAENLTKLISKMTFEQKAEYVDDLLDFAPETKALRHEIRQAERAAGKKLINRGSIKLGGTFMAIGSILVVTTITAMAANNNFTHSNINSMAAISQKIDNNEILSLDELSDYISERNEATVTREMEENPLFLAEIFEATRVANVALDNLGIDLDVDDEEETEDIEQYLPSTISTGVNNFNYNKVTSDTDEIM